MWANAAFPGSFTVKEMIGEWVFLVNRSIDGLETMIVPETKNPTPRWNWVLYAAYVLYRLYYIK